MAKTLAKLIAGHACSAKEHRQRMAIHNMALRMALTAALLRLNQLNDLEAVPKIRDILESAA